jgi:hypothetical protein
VKKTAPYLAAALGLAALALAQGKEPKGPPLATIPDSLKAPDGEKLVLQVHATGWQVYICGADNEGKPQWTLKGPDADLHGVKGEVVGHHFVGPAWKYKDGSEVTGKAVAHVDSPDPKSVAWLLLTATGHSGDGMMSRVTSIQRVNTQGGKPPATACDASQPNAEARSSYSADYYFYAPASIATKQ